MHAMESKTSNGVQQVLTGAWHVERFIGFGMLAVYFY
jgi:hypothetical protein